MTCTGQIALPLCNPSGGEGPCAQWTALYQGDAAILFPESVETSSASMPLTVDDVDYEIRDDFFTTPFGDPAYVILDGGLKVRHKLIRRNHCAIFSGKIK
jgi:hypothetical protein